MVFSGFQYSSYGCQAEVCEQQSKLRTLSMIPWKFCVVQASSLVGTSLFPGEYMYSIHDIEFLEQPERDTWHRL